MTILNYSITIFIIQLIFIAARTWNVKAVSRNKLSEALLSGAVVHLSWLVSISIGAVSMHEILDNWDWSYLPIVLCSLAGGLIGTYIGLQEKLNKIKK